MAYKAFVLFAKCFYSGWKQYGTKNVSATPITALKALNVVFFGRILYIPWLVIPPDTLQIHVIRRFPLYYYTLWVPLLLCPT